MDYKIVNPSGGRSGGVMLLWKKEVTVQQLFSAPKYIDVKIIGTNGVQWRLTRMYGKPRWQDKYMTWDKIRELNGQHDMPWAIIGDLNEILYSHEKDGRNPRPAGYMEAFRDVLTDCNLQDLGFTGDPFTWKRGWMRERLDRALVNHSWSVLFPGAALQHLEYYRSDD
jgi:hypothetical protein